MKEHTTMTPLFAVLYIPEFSLQSALRHQPELWDRPVALVDPAQRVARVVGATSAARAVGVVEGLVTPQALARCVDLLVRPRSPDGESSTMDALLQVAFGFSPAIEDTAPGLLTLDLRGLPGVLEPSQRLARARQLKAATDALGLRSRVGVGPTPNMARLAALWSEEVFVVGDATGFISALPIAALEPTAHVAGILAQWGVRTVGEFLALGRADLADRLGLEALALFASASTTSVRPLRQVRPPERFEESWEFDPAVETLEPLLFLCRRFTDSFAQRLEALGLAAEELILRLRLESGPDHQKRLRLPEPARQSEALFRCLQTHLETLRTEASVVGLSLCLEPTRPRQRQFSLFEAVIRDPHQFQETLARLSALVGTDRVGSPVREDSHRSDAFRLVAPDFENAPTMESRPGRWLQAPTPMRRLRPPAPARVEIGVRRVSSQNTLTATEVASFLRPDNVATLLSPHFGQGFQELSPTAERPVTKASEPRAASESQRQPLFVSSAVASGRIRRLEGPVRRSGHWWEGAGWAEEEWQVETERGEVLRLVCRDGHWTVDAVAD